MSRAETVPALQRVLAGEHATVYGYGVVGAHLSGAARSGATAALDAHRARRDQLAETIRSRGGEPVAAAAAYGLPAQVTSASSAIALATTLEERLAALWADAVAALAGDLRALAVVGLRDAAVAANGWRGSSVAFPGLPERSRA